MAVTAAEMLVKIGADLREFRKGMASMRSTVQQTGKKMQAAGTALTAGLTLPIAGVGAASLKTAAEFEKLRKGLESAMGSAEAAEAEFQKLQAVAQDPGLGFKQALKGSVRLQAVGFSADEARGALSEFGNALALAGGSADDLDGVALALTQIASKGQVSAEEINQIAERVPQVRTAMQEAFGTASTEKIQKMGIAAEDFVNGIVNQLGELPRASGGLANAFTNARMTIENAMRVIGEQINQAFDIQGLVERVSGLLDRLIASFQALSPQTRKMVIAFTGVAAAIGPVIAVVGTLMSMLGPLGIAITGVVSAGSALMASSKDLRKWLGKTLPKVIGSAEKVWDALAGTVSDVTKEILATVEPMLEELSDLWEDWGGVVMTAASNAWDSIITIIETAISAAGDIITFGLNIVQGDWKGAWGSIESFVGTIWNGIKDTILRSIDTILAGLGKLLSFIPGLEDKIGDLRSAVQNMLPAAAVAQDAGRVQSDLAETGDVEQQLATTSEQAQRQIQGSHQQTSTVVGQATGEMESSYIDLAGRVRAVRQSIQSANDAMITSYEDMAGTSAKAIDQIPKSLDNIPKSVDRAAKAAEVGFTQKMKNAFQNPIGALNNLKRAITGGDGVLGAIAGPGGLVRKATSLLSAAGPWGAAIGGAIKIMETLGIDVKGIVKGIGNALKSMASSVGSVFKSIAKGIGSFFSSIWDGVKGVISGIGDFLGFGGGGGGGSSRPNFTNPNPGPGTNPLNQDAVSVIQQLMSSGVIGRRLDTASLATARSNFDLVRGEGQGVNQTIRIFIDGELVGEAAAQNLPRALEARGITF